MKERNLGVPERPLLDKHSRDILDAEVNALGGSVIFSSHEENKLRYKLGLVGMFLTSDGVRLQQLTKRYLLYLKARYDADKEIERFSSKEFSSWSEKFSDSELNELRQILYSSQRSFASSMGGWNKDEWFISVDDEVVNLKHVQDWDAFIEAEILKQYKPKAPVSEVERIRQSGIFSSQSGFNTILSELQNGPKGNANKVGKIDISFINDNALREILESDWGEAMRLLDIGAWKSCIILCGSILEGLLLWKLEEAQRGISLIDLPDSPPIVDYQNFSLSLLLRDCREKNLIASEAMHLTEWAREYRNLVHPGNQRRHARNVAREHAIIAINMAILVANGMRMN